VAHALGVVMPHVRFPPESSWPLGNQRSYCGAQAHNHNKLGPGLLRKHQGVTTQLAAYCHNKSGDRGIRLAPLGEHGTLSLMCMCCTHGMFICSPMYSNNNGIP
jgi:hypothetical protein